VSGVISPSFMYSVLDEGEWLVSRPGHFTPKDVSPGTYWVACWVDPRADFDSVEKRISFSCRKSNPDNSTCNLAVLSNELMVFIFP
jgi:hypothetical protein